VDRIIQQTKLSFFTPKKEPLPPKKPTHNINWIKTSPHLKKYLLLHLIRAFTENNNSSRKISKKGLINILNQNMGGIVKNQLKIYIENLIYREYIQELPNYELRYTDKIYEDLKIIDKIIRKQMYSKKQSKMNRLKYNRGFKE